VTAGDDDRLTGVLTLAAAVSWPSHLPVAEVMTPSSGLRVDMPVTDVVHAFRDQDLISAPVVNGDGALLGRITIDDVVDVITEEAERSILAPAGLAEDRDLFAPVRTTVSQRGVWLAVNLACACLAAWVIGRFESSIEQLVALAVLMPVVASMGGVAGQPSLALVIRGLALNHVGRANRWRLLRHEMANGVVIGVLFALVVAVVAFVWYRNAELSAIIAVALVGNVFIGTSMGTVYPLVMKRLNIDPALAGGMALTATTDVVGFFALLALGTLLLL
jgi:magnesium transporter